MYGKPEWFQRTNQQWLVRPNSWQGWAYVCAWVAAMMLPGLALFARQQGPEAFTWLLLSGGLWLWDSATIRKASRAKTEEPFYIGEEAESAV